MTTRMKRCPGCGQTKPSADFGRNRAQHDGLAVYCRTCRAATAAVRRQALPAVAAATCATCGQRPRRDRGIGRECTRCHDAGRDRAKRQESQRRRRQSLRLELLTAYGGACVRCGEEDTDVLVFDHVDDDGADHRRKLGNQRVYEQLKRAGFPPVVQVLCANDNMRKERERLGIARQQIAP